MCYDVAGIHYGGEKTWELVELLSTEPDIAVQLFGSKPEQFKEAAAQISERLGNKLALIDINMACPVPKVVKKGEGSALLDTPELAADLVKACLSEVAVPVTVKIRRGRRHPHLPHTLRWQYLQSAQHHLMATEKRGCARYGT